jgi:uncharacterized protein YjbI with pentapeptide repeats
LARLTLRWENLSEANLSAAVLREARFVELVRRKSETMGGKHV